MSDIQVDVSNSLDSAIEEIKLCSAKEALEALNREARSIEVPENTELLISPANRELASCFSRVQLKSYTDLQILGYVPHGLAEEKVRNAIVADDHEAYKIATTMPHWPTRNCECEGHGTDTARSLGKSIRFTYNSIRKSHNPTLTNLLSDHYGTRIPWDSPLATMIARWEKRIDQTVLIVLIKDIIINRNATLTVAPRDMTLLAYNIWIHETAQLVQKSRYLKIWANSINSFNNFFSAADINAVGTIAPPWLQTEERR